MRVAKLKKKSNNKIQLLLLIFILFRVKSLLLLAFSQLEKTIIFLVFQLTFSIK